MRSRQPLSPPLSSTLPHPQPSPPAHASESTRPHTTAPDSAKSTPAPFPSEPPIPHYSHSTETRSRAPSASRVLRPASANTQSTAHAPSKTKAPPPIHPDAEPGALAP